MGKSILVFISHSSEDKSDLIEPIAADLEDCYINVWLDKRKILPGDNLRKSIFKDGLDKADIALIFFTEKSLKSSWVDREIKHVLREESKIGNNFDLKKIISIFDSEETYKQISDRYPELTDDLLHLMPKNYNKTQFGQLISAIWSKYLLLQGGDVATQKQMLSKDRELFQKEKEIQELKNKLIDFQSKNSNSKLHEEFDELLSSGKIDSFIQESKLLLSNRNVDKNYLNDVSECVAFGLIEHISNLPNLCRLTDKGKDFFKWYFLNKTSQKK